MKSLSRVAALGLALLAYPLPALAQAPQEIPFDSVPNFLKMPPRPLPR